jgi:hypothetical protein
MSSRFHVAVGLVLAALVAATDAAASPYSTYVSYEAVDNFSQQQGFPNIQCIAEASGYVSGLTGGSNPLFFPKWEYQDDNVWDTDFVDPDITRTSYDDDTLNFDFLGQSSAYFCGHGLCDDDPSVNYAWQSCTTSSQCTNPQPAGSYGNGYCLGKGPSLGPGGWCFYARNRNMIINNAPGNNYHNGWIEYSDGKFVKWGESANSGGWAGAGTNGGINFAIISNSCGLRPWFQWQELANVFAGTHLVGVLMPIVYGSDVVDAPDRGQWIANGYVTNSGSSVALSFLDAINSITQNEGRPCPLAGSHYTYGGGHGINGCGAHAIMSVDSTASSASWHVQVENWHNVTDDGYDAKGAGYNAILVLCNYDCNKYPITL